MYRLKLRSISAAWLLACTACAFDTSGATGGDGGGTEGWHEADGSTSSPTPKPDDGDTKGSQSGTSDGPSSTGSDGGDTSTSGTNGHTDEGESDTEADGDPVVPFCDAADSHLVGCYVFDDIAGGSLNDGSSHGNHGSVQGVGTTLGPLGQALTFSQNSRVEVPDSPSLDLTTDMTLEAWVRIDQLPTSGRMGVMDNDGQYAIFVYPGAGLRCSASNDTLFAAASADTWMHVACVLGNGGHRMYIDGVLMAQSGYVGPLPTANTNPLAIGDDSPSFNEPLEGALGALRIWSRPLDAAELCQAAGELCSQ